jgi:hypothetical protein
MYCKNDFILQHEKLALEVSIKQQNNQFPQAVTLALCVNKTED